MVNGKPTNTTTPAYAQVSATTFTEQFAVTVGIMYDFYITATNTVGTSPPAIAVDKAASPPPPGAQAPRATLSHYVPSADPNAATALANRDVGNINGVCGSYMLILDFGQPESVGSGTYNGYGTSGGIEQPICEPGEHRIDSSQHLYRYVWGAI